MKLQNQIYKNNNINNIKFCWGLKHMSMPTSVQFPTIRGEICLPFPLSRPPSVGSPSHPNPMAPLKNSQPLWGRKSARESAIRYHGDAFISPLITRPHPPPPFTPEPPTQTQADTQFSWGKILIQGKRERQTETEKNKKKGKQTVCVWERNSVLNFSSKSL